MGAFGGKSWGSWHTSDAIPGPCPQGDGWHTVDDATTLNEKDREYKLARAWARHKEWIGAPGTRRHGS